MVVGKGPRLDPEEEIEVGIRDLGLPVRDRPLRGRRLWAILACVAAFAVIASRPSLVLFVLFMAYALSGYVMWGMGQRVRPVLPEE